MLEMEKLGLNMVEEAEANSEVAALYEDFKHDFQMPTVPNYIKSLAISPPALRIFTDMMRTFGANIMLPQSLMPMICFAIARHNNCEYCSALHESSCRTLGVDEETLTILTENLSALNPERIRAIIEFALKAAKHPKTLTPDDYQGLRDLGISNEEIFQIIFISALGQFNDIIADSIRIEIDSEFKDVLGK